MPDVMKEERESGAVENEEAISCEVTLRGELSPEWSDWFEGLAIILQADGTTRLSGVLEDQAALHGLLRAIRDVGLSLVSVNCNRCCDGNATKGKEEA